jgi:protein SCO1
MHAARRRLPAAVALIAAVLVGACGSRPAPNPNAVHPGFQGLIIRPEKPAPRLVLRNYTGQPVNLSWFRGRPVLVTFVYTHCPDVCPLIVSSLAAAKRQLVGQAHRVEIVAVTVDPKRDTPSAVRQFLAVRHATATMDYLIGTRKQLLPIWKAWGIGVTVGRYNATESHSALLFGITPAGKIAVVYSSNFTPAQIVHDVPLLARS